MSRVYPSYRYHKDHGAIVIHNEAQHERLASEGWHDSPAAFEEKSEKPEESHKEKLSRELAKLGDSELESPEQTEGHEPTEEELRAELLEMGFSKKDLKGKSVDELKALLA